MIEKQKIENLLKQIEREQSVSNQVKVIIDILRSVDQRMVCEPQKCETAYDCRPHFVVAPQPIKSRAGYTHS